VRTRREPVPGLVHAMYHSVGVRRAGSFSEQVPLLMRDFLRHDDESAAEYEAVERELADRFAATVRVRRGQTAVRVDPGGQGRRVGAAARLGAGPDRRLTRPFRVTTVACRRPRRRARTPARNRWCVDLPFASRVGRIVVAEAGTPVSSHGVAASPVWCGAAVDSTKRGVGRGVANLVPRALSVSCFRAIASA